MVSCRVVVKRKNILFFLYSNFILRFVLMTSVTRLGDLLKFGNFLKTLASINLPKSSTFLGNFCIGVKIYHSSSEVIFD